ncbi:MAG: FtsQ-type POTRA domain-containing protein [Clostridia bacterium]|nr:FtsQ-type POTRA domain-containing protein [Clostridia bacterium]
MNQQPDNALEARKEARRRRRRRRQIMQIFIILAVVLLLALVGTLVVLHIVGNQAAKKGETTNFMAVKAIEVEGETRYTAEQLIEQSGLYVGQSLLAVNKVQAHDSLLAAFPYLCHVEVGNASFDTLRIYVEETPVMGAVEMADTWMVVGANNHALERMEEAAVPGNMLRIVGATTLTDQLGQLLLDERSLRVCKVLTEAAETYGLDRLVAIDVTEKTNIVLEIGAGMEVVLGNETNLEVQVETLVDTLPTLLENNGVDAKGRLDMTAYADDDPSNDRSIYTPEDVLADRENAANATTGTAADGNTTATAAGTTTP